MRNTLIAAFALSALVAGTAIAKADDFGGQQQTNGGANAYMDQQAANSQLSDPTAPNSIRSHGGTGSR